MNRTARIKARPKLTDPLLLAAWPGVGNISSIVAGYLHEKLPFKKLGELIAPLFFEPIGVLARDNVVDVPQFPASRFYYYKGKGQERDLILFIGDDQPSTDTYSLAEAVLAVATRFQVRRVITCAAALTRIHFTEPPRVWGVATSRELADELAAMGLENRSTIQIAGLNGLLLGVAKEHGLEGICLLGEVPAHASRIDNPAAALAVLEVLLRLLNLSLDTSDLAEAVREYRQQMREATAIAMGEYIEHFTQPIWQQGDNGEEEDEEDDEDEYN